MYYLICIVYYIISSCNISIIYYFIKYNFIITLTFYNFLCFFIVYIFIYLYKKIYSKFDYKYNEHCTILTVYYIVQ